MPKRQPAPRSSLTPTSCSWIEVRFDEMNFQNSISTSGPTFLPAFSCDSGSAFRMFLIWRVQLMMEFSSAWMRSSCGTYALDAHTHTKKNQSGGPQAREQLIR